ncbi:hypothetical protein BHM03_00007097 [Ensete ventricosum]|nr:hypothetical protein BHM03_00007097 [Ensete ventricosum]
MSSIVPVLNLIQLLHPVVVITLICPCSPGNRSSHGHLPLPTEPLPSSTSARRPYRLCFVAAATTPHAATPPFTADLHHHCSSPFSLVTIASSRPPDRYPFFLPYRCIPCNFLQQSSIVHCRCPFFLP